MKKVFSILMVAFAITAMVACDKEDNGNNGGGTNPGGEVVDTNWVDLGLPSGVLWAKCNVGATAPEEYGDYFAWGETTTKEVYNWSTYRYCTVDGEGNVTSLTKYNTWTIYGEVDSLTTLEPCDDAATVNMGGDARTPTYDEWNELLNNTTAEWTTLNGVYGQRFTSNTNGNSIFLPAAGCRLESFYICDSDFGGYWPSSLDENIPLNAYHFLFELEGDKGLHDAYRGGGYSVRAVRAK